MSLITLLWIQSTSHVSFKNNYKYISLQFQERRCITEQECREMPSPRGVTFPQSSAPQHYKSFEKSCILLCPNNYIQTEKPDGNLTCEPCSKESK